MENTLCHSEKELLDELESRNRQIAAVHSISSLLSSTLDLDERLRHILLVSMRTVDAEAGTIYLHRPADSKLVFQYVVGDKADQLTGMAIDDDFGIVGAVFHSGEPQVTNRPRESSEHRAELGERVGFHTESVLTVPIKYQAGRPVGVMQILNKRRGEFTKNDLEVLEIVSSISATAIENAHLAREAQTAAVARVLGELSHDIKNKVAPIPMVVYTLRPEADAMYEELDRICADFPAAAERIASATSYFRTQYNEQFDMVMDQVQDVEFYTKLIADAIQGTVSEPQIEPNDLAVVIDKQLNALDPFARKAGITLARDYEGVPSFRFDRVFIERAVFNLVNNAIPETPRGGSITVRARAITGGQFPEGRCVNIEVTDTGRGMPPHVLARILSGNAKSTKQGGTGLGTRIIYNAVAAHKGRFEGESKENEGTTFRLKLPYLEA